MSFRIMALDWSGAVAGASTKIWVAEASDGALVRLECGRGREALADFLIGEAKQRADLVVGLDFAFSLPAWFLEDRELRSAPELWELATREAEEWLSRCETPFWGRPGKGRPRIQEELRQTDRNAPPVGSIRPKSVFQIGGAGAVGTGSLRGMPILKRLRDEGFAVWPFDASRRPLVVEIYPRLLTGAVNKGDAAARAAYLRERYPSLSGDLLARAAGSEDAFDAAVSALVMDAARYELRTLPTLADRHARLEGQIWWPGMAETLARAGAAAAGPTPSGSPEHSPPQRDSPVHSLEEWRAVVMTMLPKPVHEYEAGTLVGGEPGEVVVRIAPGSIAVSRFGVRWDGHVPEDRHVQVASFDPNATNPARVARAIAQARGDRLRTYGWCAWCRDVNPPEWMHDESICQGCAQQHLGVVY